MMNDLLSIHLAASIWMTALICYVQLVHYPSFAYISAEKFCEFHVRHSRNTTLLVLFPMLVELTSAASLAWKFPSVASFILAGLTLVTWALTFLVFVPLHNRLAQGADRELISRLISINWLRTFTWTLKLLWAFVSFVESFTSSSG